MNNRSDKRLVIIDEQFERFEGHYYAYDKSVSEIFAKHGYKTTIYGRSNMLPELKQELGAIPWFTINTQPKVRKIPVLGPILYRTGFWKQYEQDIRKIIAENEGAFIFFPNVYWYNILPIARALKNTHVKAAILYRTSIFDTIRLPKAILPVTLGIIKHSVKLVKGNKNVHFYTDSEVIANEWSGQFQSLMKVLPIPHLVVNKRDGSMPDNGKVRMYLPGGMRVEKGAELLTIAFENLAATRPDLLKRITLVTQFVGNDPALDGYKQRLAKLPVDNEFLQHLTTEEYNRQLCIADIILIPYQVSEGYRARTSGILAEAIASSKPFITTDGTWMSVQARKFDTGLVIQDGQPQQLADAIDTMVKSFETYNSKAIAACDKWMSTQSDEVFYEQLNSATHH